MGHLSQISQEYISLFTKGFFNPFFFNYEPWFKNVKESGNKAGGKTPVIPQLRHIARSFGGFPFSIF